MLLGAIVPADTEIDKVVACGKVGAVLSIGRESATHEQRLLNAENATTSGRNTLEDVKATLFNGESVHLPILGSRLIGLEGGCFIQCRTSVDSK
jgi:hypothetical protein